MLITKLGWPLDQPVEFCVSKTCSYLLLFSRYNLYFDICGLVMIFCSNTRAGNTCQGGSVFLVTYTFPCLFGPSVGEIAHDQNGAQGDAGALRRQILRVQTEHMGLGKQPCLGSCIMDYPLVN